MNNEHLQSRATKLNEALESYYLNSEIDKFQKASYLITLINIRQLVLSGCIPPLSVEQKKICKAKFI